MDIKSSQVNGADAQGLSHVGNMLAPGNITSSTFVVTRPDTSTDNSIITCGTAPLSIEGKTTVIGHHTETATGEQPQPASTRCTIMPRRVDYTSQAAFVTYMQRVMSNPVVTRGRDIYIGTTRMQRTSVYDEDAYGYKYVSPSRAQTVSITYDDPSDILTRSYDVGGTVMHLEMYTNNVLIREIQRAGDVETTCTYYEGNLICKKIVRGTRTKCIKYFALCTCGQFHARKITTTTNMPALNDVMATVQRRVRMYVVPADSAATHEMKRDKHGLLMSDYLYVHDSHELSTFPWLRNGTCYDYAADCTYEAVFVADELQREKRSYLNKAGVPKVRTEHFSAVK